jgi:uncharacterized lipoprotein YddW (UPF0748 family)
MRIALAALIVGCASTQEQPREELRAIWVTRWDYRTADDVKTIVANCASLGVTDVIWQCRGQADAYYRSSLEPWGELIGGKDPGFDPLELAVKEAHAKGLKIHAWINAMPVWRGKAKPSPESIAGKHPDWVVVGKDGKPQAPNDHYLCANPAKDEWVRHVCAVAADIVSRYDVDGLHLDYIRYLEGDWSYDETTLSKFGAKPDEKKEEWTEFRRGLVTEAVRRIRESVRKARASATLTAAVYPNRLARSRIHQDAERWVKEGLVDLVFPMQYNDKDADFFDRVKEARESFGDKVVPGIGVFKHETAEQTGRQLEFVRTQRCRGVALFCYANFWKTHDESYARSPQSLRDARIDAVRRLFGR